MLEIYNKLEQIATEPSTLEKTELLRNFLTDGDFKSVVQYTLDQNKQYAINVLPDASPNAVPGSTQDILNFLTELSKKPGATKLDKQHLADLASANTQTRDVVIRVINKDLRCGVGSSLVNEAVPNTVKDMRYMRCSGMEFYKRVSFPAVVEKKADGTFGNFFVSVAKDSLDILSRQGNPSNILGNLKDEYIEIAKLMDISDPVFMGEMLVLNKSRTKVLDRKTGNGIITKAQKGTITEEEASRIICEIWDVVPAEDFWKGVYNVDYKTRFSMLRTAVIASGATKILPIAHRIVNNIQEAFQFFIEMRNEGFEGAVLKDWKTIWKDHTSTTQIKLKCEVDCEFRLIGVYHGEAGKKYEHCIGGYTVESEDHLIVTNVGSGLSDEQRGYIVTNRDPKTRKIIGKPVIDLDIAAKTFAEAEAKIGKAIYTIRFESVVDDKTERKTSKLYLPRVIEERPDKTIADTKAYCLQDVADAIKKF